MLNNVAYILAEHDLSLGLAQEYAEKAVAELDEQAQIAVAHRDAAFRATYGLSLAWDTLGWIFFKQGDVARAEGLVRPAWFLGEDGIVAEHLGEIYEKENKVQKAASAYEWALAVSSESFSTFGMQLDAVKTYRSRTDAIKARYKKLTGKEPSVEIQRLPNGQWTKTPAEQLRQTRKFRLNNESKLSGSANFVVVFKPGAIETAEYLSGGDDLGVLTEKLKGARYPIEFPPGSKAILVVQVKVECQESAGCIGTLINPAPAPR